MDEMEEVQYNIFVDLDAILDTRLPILHAIDETTMVNEVKSGRYTKRLRDTFGVISNDIFTALYSGRNKSTLLASGPTHLFNLLIETCIELKTIKKTMGDVSKLKLYLNIYPYELSMEEQDNFIIMLSNIVSDIEVIPVSMNIKELDPSWVKSRIGTIIKYDSLKWLEYHMALGNLFKASIMSTVLYAPAIVTGSVKLKDITMDTFDNLVTSTSTIIDLNMLQIKQYCLRPYEKKN